MFFVVQHVKLELENVKEISCMSEKTIRNRIKENYEAFSAKELRVAEYVMKN